MPRARSESAPAYADDSADYLDDLEEGFTERDMHMMSIEDDMDRGLAGPGELAEYDLLGEDDYDDEY